MWGLLCGVTLWHSLAPNCQNTFAFRAITLALGKPFLSPQSCNIIQGPFWAEAHRPHQGSIFQASQFQKGAQLPSKLQRKDHSWEVPGCQPTGGHPMTEYSPPWGITDVLYHWAVSSCWGIAAPSQGTALLPCHPSWSECKRKQPSGLRLCLSTKTPSTSFHVKAEAVREFSLLLSNSTGLC